jgi:hypothetical protein
MVKGPPEFDELPGVVASGDAHAAVNATKATPAARAGNLLRTTFRTALCMTALTGLTPFEIRLLGGWDTSTGNDVLGGLEQTLDTRPGQTIDWIGVNSLTRARSLVNSHIAAAG